MSCYLCFSFLNLNTILRAVLAINAFGLFCYVIHGNVLRFFLCTSCRILKKGGDV